MFAHVKEHEASKIDNPRPVDLTPECLSMMEKLMLAQAQVRACAVNVNSCRQVCIGTSYVLQHRSWVIPMLAQAQVLAYGSFGLL
jgi:hypothetical protein